MIADTDLILTLTALNFEANATILLCDNASRFVPAPIVDRGPSREVTPSDSEMTVQMQTESSYSDCLQLRFSDTTKVTGRIMFGGDSSQCDVLLVPKMGQFNISRQHFYLTFTKDDDGGYVPVIRDVSKNGLILEYDRQVIDEQPRRHFEWRLFQGYDTFTIHVGNPRLQFQIVIPYLADPTCRNQYNKNAEHFLEDTAPAALSGLDLLNMRDTGTTTAPSEDLPANRKPLYLEGLQIGSGSYGFVSIFRNASTGAFFAGKQLYKAGKSGDNEIEILRRLKHDNIVRFVDCCRLPKRLLIMEYLPLGNLFMQHEISRFTSGDIKAIICQCLSGLEHIHSQDVVHRDLKPQNILVHSRDPVHIKIADFGLAQAKLVLATLCGTLRYVAPEVRQGCYTKAVDLWSLGVVGWEYLYGLPDLPELAHQYHDTLVMYAAETNSDPLADLIREHMLCLQPQDRSSAEHCLLIAMTITGDMLPSTDAMGSRSTSLSGEETVQLTQISTVQSGKRQRTQATCSIENECDRVDKRSRIPSGSTQSLASCSKPQHAAPLCALSLRDGSTSEAIAVRELPRTECKDQPAKIILKNGFSKIECGGTSISIRITDRKVNLTQILKSENIDRVTRAAFLRQKWLKKLSEVVKGGMTNQGTYASIAIAAIVCQELGLVDMYNDLRRFEHVTQSRISTKTLQSNE